MDEPLASLDEARREEILPYVERLRDELGLPIVHVSHSVAEVSRLADTVVVLSEGRTVAAGPVGEVFGRIDLFPALGRQEAGAVVEARVLREEPEWGLTVLALNGEELRVGALRLAPGTPVRVHIRARDVMLALERPRAISALNVLACRIAALGEAEGAVEVLLDLGGEALAARVTRKTVADLALAPGRRVFAVVKSVAVERRSIAAAPHLVG
jgi:molybdate transport system ATP-binding protein